MTDRNIFAAPFPDYRDNSLEPVRLEDDLRTTVIGGRVTTLELPDADIVGVSVLERPAAGNVTVNPDNTLALVLTGHNNAATESMQFKIEVTRADGTVSVETVHLTVSPTLQDAGWGAGQHYMLQTDAAGDLVIEPGTTHRKVYVSGDDDALSLGDIAALEGLDVNRITKEWLSRKPEYGSTPEMALDAEAGMALWYEITDRFNDEPASHWLLFERGHDYGDVGRLIARGARGESELHPQLIGAYGTGDRPVIQSQVRMFQTFSENIVVRDLDFKNGVRAFWADNVIFDNIAVTGDHLNVKGIDGFTLRNSEVLDVVRDEPLNSADGTWEQVSNRISGLYLSGSNGVAVEGNLFDHNGWEDDYDYNVSTEFGQPPSFYSHNVYIQNSNSDVTFRDNITMQGASFGAQIRSGGYIEDNVFLDNNAALNSHGGNVYDVGYIGSYSLFSSNLITSGGHKRVAEKEGALTMGVGDYGNLSSLVDNIIAHLADPNNPDEIAEKVVVHHPLEFSSRAEGPIYDDTIIYNWTNRNNPGVMDNFGPEAAVLDQTTIQIFAAELLGRSTATISDLAEHLRATADGALNDMGDADLIIAFFQKGFGIAADIRTEADTLRFVPNALGDGIRWDNRLNWDTNDLPGAVDGDSVALAGNRVEYSGTTTLETLDLGSGGRLAVSQGYLSVGELLTGPDGGAITIDRAGQVWTASYGDDSGLSLSVAGGRFANTGLFDGVADIAISDNAETILASSGASFILKDDSRLSISGSEARVGFDGPDGGAALLELRSGAELILAADAHGFGSIGEFASGHFATRGDVFSTVDLGDAHLVLDLSKSEASFSQPATLIDVDELIGTFGSVEVRGTAPTRDAYLTYDYVADAVTLKLGQEGHGSGKLHIAEVLETGMPPNADPEANDDIYGTAFATALTVTAAEGVLANDTDPDFDTLDIQVTRGPAHGVLDLSSTGGFTYTPTADFSGQDSFIYEVSDDRGGVDTARVRIDVAANPVPEPLRIKGTEGNDRLIGTDADEIFQALGGRMDVLQGGGGADVFDFSAAIGNGVRETRVILDFTPGEDLIDLGDHEISSSRAMGDKLFLYVNPELDVLILDGLSSYQDSYFV